MILKVVMMFLKLILLFKIIIMKWLKKITKIELNKISFFKLKTEDNNTN